MIACRRTAVQLMVVAQLITATATTTPINTKADLVAATEAWCADAAAAEATYGPIGSWDVTRVTDFGYLFSRSHNPLTGDDLYPRRPNIDTCNPPIGGWKTGQVTTMRYNFRVSRSTTPHLIRPSHIPALPGRCSTGQQASTSR